MGTNDFSSWQNNAFSSLGAPAPKQLQDIANNLPKRAPKIAFDSHIAKNAWASIYLDYAAATPVFASAQAIAMAFADKYFANPANQLHEMGIFANYALEESRIALAKTLACQPQQIVFTSSATEANNLITRGMWHFVKRKRNKILVCATEHSSVLRTLENLQELFPSACQVQIIPVDQQGQIDPQHFAKLADNQTLMACVMDVNNETGIIQGALPELFNICEHHGIHLHVDAVQGFARGLFPNPLINFHSATISGAKIYGPKGAAALIFSHNSLARKIAPQLTGGAQEFGLRAGTPNVPAIVGMSTAAAIFQENALPIAQHFKSLEELFLAYLKEALRGRLNVNIHGSSTQRASGILNLSFENTNAMKIAELATGVCVGVGSACKTLQATASHVLLAMGLSLEEALSSLRISFGVPTTQEEAKRAATIIAEAALLAKSGQASLT